MPGGSRSREHDRAHPLEDPQEPGAGPVDADALEHAAASPGRARRRRSGTPPRTGRRGPRRTSSSSSSVLRDGRAIARRPGSPSRAIGAPAAASMPLGVVAARDGLDHRRRVRDEPRQQHARLDLRARDRQLVLDPGERRAVNGERREPALARLDPRAHQRQRLGDPVDRAAADRVVAVELEARPLLEREPTRAAAASACPRCPTSIGSPGAHRVAQPASADHRARRARCSTIAPSVCTAASVELRVGGVEVVADPYRLRRHRADHRRAMGDRLVGRHRDAPPQAVRMGRSACSCPRHRESELADELLGAARLLLAGDPQRDDALAHVGRRVQRHVGDVDARPGRARARARATTPGRFGTDARSSNSGPPASCASSSRRAVVARRRRSRRSIAGGVGAGQRVADRGQARDRVVDQRRQRVAVRDVDVGPDRARRAGDAGRVAEARAGRRAACSSPDGERPGGLGRRARWRARAAGARPSPGCGRGSRGRSPSGGRRARAGAGEAARRGSPTSSSVGVRYQVAPSNRSARACSTPEVSAPASGWPPTNRGSSSAATIARLVEPTSVTTQSAGAAASTAADRLGQRRPPARRRTRPRRRATASATSSHARSIAPRSSGASRAPPARVVTPRPKRRGARARPARSSRRSARRRRRAILKRRGERLARDRRGGLRRAPRSRRTRPRRAAAGRRRSLPPGAGGPRR